MKATSASRTEALSDAYAAGARRPRRWHAANRGNDAILEERRRALAELLRARGVTGLDRAKVLEVGCGRGDGMRMLAALGADAERIVGVDILPERLAEARPRVDSPLVSSDARALAIRTGSVDVVCVLTTFSSIGTRHDRATAAHEIDRVLRPGGRVLWYDVRVLSPANRFVSPVRSREIRTLFAGYTVSSRSVTLVPAVARRLGRLTRATYSKLARVRVLRTHRVAVLVKSRAIGDES
jgi:ubiquinone/menaquinone biosynthesis C-methylase UbiE